MKLEIITPYTHLLYDDVQYVNLPSLQGECGILPQHVYTILSLTNGLLHYKKEGQLTSFPIYQGVAIIKENTIRVLTESIELS